MIDSDKEIENEFHNAGECYFASAEEWAEDNISWRLEDFADVSEVAIEYNNPKSASEIIELISGWSKQKSPVTGISFCKNPLVNNVLRLFAMDLYVWIEIWGWAVKTVFPFLVAVSQPYG